MSLIVALEGCVHAGKTSLLRALEFDRNVEVIEEFVEYASESYPDPPQSVAEARSAIEWFMKLDGLRQAGCDRSKPICIVDRSVLSVIGYEYALGQLNTSEEYWKETRHLFRKESWLWPNICAYLSIDDQLISERHKLEKAEYKPLLLNNRFNEHLRRFYEEVLPSEWPAVTLVQLDGSKESDSLATELRAAVRGWLAERA